MAKVDGGALSLGVTGTVGGILTFSTWKGRPYVRRRVTPKNPNTAAQQGIRAGMSFGGALWSELNDGDKATWEGMAQQNNYSPFNAFVSVGQGNIANNLGYQRQNPAEASDPPGAPTGQATAVNGRQVVFSWTDVDPTKMFGMALYVSDTTGFTEAPANLKTIVKPGDEQAVLTLDPGTYYYRLRPFDFAGVMGTHAAQGTFTIA